LETHVVQLQDTYDLGQWQLVCGLLDDDENHAIYAIDGISAVEVARQFGTGSHNNWPEAVDEVCEELSRVFEIAPFRPYFADAAGYKCRFTPPISRTQAEMVGQLVTQGLEAYVSEGLGEDRLFVETLISENGLRLWWD
jgi:hypothetical protein